MRPALLDPLFAPITTLEGIGPKVARMIENVVPADLGGREARVGDLIFTLPHSVIDRRNRPGIALAADGAIVTLDVRVDR
ncbi:MAG: ATP-dependent DNA helicase RecG, partial [Hyphomicrobiales bacterium]|nr:ATP-dependent DNA helicase RecG [Hyphomicrobiales bacterium]